MLHKFIYVAQICRSATSWAQFN